MAANKTIGNIPLGEKMNLSIAEASVYTGIGQVTLRKWLSRNMSFCSSPEWHS